MKIKLYASSGIFENNVIMDGFTLNGYLTLFQDPDQELEAATKRYVDGFPQALSTDQIVSSEIPKRLILGGFGGDLMGFNGTDAYLSPTGVAPDTYNQVTVNDKGRVTAAQKVTGTNTTVHFSNLVDTPTTAAGYVSDTSKYAVKTAGVASEVTFSGALHSSAAVVANTNAVNRQYIINALGGMVASELPVGSFKMSTLGNAGAKYLRANGGTLSKTAYAALYAVIGDTYTPAELNGIMGQPWRQQYAFNTQQSTDITGWTTGTSLPTTVHGSQAIVTKNRVYLLGGLVSSTVYTAPINEDGTLGTWTTGTPLPAAVGYSQAIVTNNRVYLLGGMVYGSPSSTVYTAPILPDGTLGTWTTGTPLPAAVTYSQAIVTKNRVYLLGGQSGSSVSTVYTAPIISDGTLGAWTTGTSLPATVFDSHAIVTQNRVYLLGGGVNGSSSSTVYTAPVLSDGTLGTWITGTSLPSAVRGSQVSATKNRVYLLGGMIDGSTSSAVYTAPILSDGTLGTWTTGTSLPATVSQSQAIVTKNRVYLLAGYNDGGPFSTVYTAPFSGGTSDYLTLIAENTIDTSTQFKLPDLTAKSFDSFDYYIKALP